MHYYPKNTIYQIPEEELIVDHIYLVEVPMSKGTCWWVLKLTKDGGPRERDFDVLGQFWELELAQEYLNFKGKNNAVSLERRKI